MIIASTTLTYLIVIHALHGLHSVDTPVQIHRYRPSVCKLCMYRYRSRHESTRNSAIADKTHDAFLQYAMAGLTPETRPSPGVTTSKGVWHK